MDATRPSKRPNPFTFMASPSIKPLPPPKFHSRAKSLSVADGHTVVVDKDAVEANGWDKLSMLPPPSTSKLHTQRASRARSSHVGDVSYRFSTVGTWLLFVALSFFFIGLYLQGSTMLRHMEMSEEDGSQSWAGSRSRTHSHKPIRQQVSGKGRSVRANQRRSSGLDVEKLRMEVRNPLRKPRLALVTPDLSNPGQTAYLLTVGRGLKHLGYIIQVLSLHEGPLRSAWEDLGIPVQIIVVMEDHIPAVDWLKYDGVICNNLDVKQVVYGLSLQPFTSVPLIWAVHDARLSLRLASYAERSMVELVQVWARVFRRADRLAFPSAALQEAHELLLSTGVSELVPATPVETWAAEMYMGRHSRNKARAAWGARGHQSFVITVAGSSRPYRSHWREHALVLRVVATLLKEAQEDNSSLRQGLEPLLLILGHGNSTCSYKSALMLMARELGLGEGMVVHVGVDEDAQGAIWAADVIVHMSLKEEAGFPVTLLQAMAFSRPLVSTRLSSIVQSLSEDVALLVPPGDEKALHAAMAKLWPHATTTTTQGHEEEAEELLKALGRSSRRKALELGALEAVRWYAKSLEDLIPFGTEVEVPLPVGKLNELSPLAWIWPSSPKLVVPSTSNNELAGVAAASEKEEALPEGEEEREEEGAEEEEEDAVAEAEKWWHKLYEEKAKEVKVDDVDFETLEEQPQPEVEELLEEREEEFPEEVTEEDREEQKQEEATRVEEEELRDRVEKWHPTLEEVHKSVKKAERDGELERFHERDDGELERTGQPICIYQPYSGQGAWPFLYRGNPAFRGIALDPEARRLDTDDVEATRRLPLLTGHYYREALCEMGAFFAIAMRIDAVHRNAWIGFQPWRAADGGFAISAQALSRLNEVTLSGQHGDTVYFWAKTSDQGGIVTTGGEAPLEDFWLTCDALNAGNCRSVFLEAFKRMYGLPNTWTLLPPMPPELGPRGNAESWSAANAWAMPTSSFVEFVMFSRMFVDALDSRFYNSRDPGRGCPLSRTRVEASSCYCRVLERLVNVWAYHSARRLIYVDPETGDMREHHDLENRRGMMWVKWFSRGTLKSMDEDRAEAADDMRRGQRWLWPHTGEVYWSGTAERERANKARMKELKQQAYEQKLKRMRERYHQQSLDYDETKGKRKRPKPTNETASSSTDASADTDGQGDLGMAGGAATGGREGAGQSGQGEGKEAGQASREVASSREGMGGAVDGGKDDEGGVEGMLGGEVKRQQASAERRRWLLQEVHDGVGGGYGYSLGQEVDAERGEEGKVGVTVVDPLGTDSLPRLSLPREGLKKLLSAREAGEGDGDVVVGEDIVRWESREPLYRLASLEAKRN